MKKLRIFCLLAMLGLFGLCGCSNSDDETEALKKQMEELQKQNEELSNELNKTDVTLAPTNTPVPTSTPTPEPTATPTPTPAPTNTPTLEPTPTCTPTPAPTATCTPLPSPTLEPTVTPKPTSTPNVIPEIMIPSTDIYLDGESQAISVSVKNANGRPLHCTVENTKVVNCVWGSGWNNGTTSLTFNPVSTGKTTVKVYFDEYYDRGITINVESYVPAPTLIPEEIFTNKEWISEDGGWEFTIDSVDVHKMCNKYSDRNDMAQCIIITYSYKNTGYYGFNGEDGLYISSMDIDVYDEEGVSAQTYPCIHTKFPSEVIAGTKCSNAQEAYVLENPSDEIMIVVEIDRYDTGEDETRKFKVKVGEDKITPTPKPTVNKESPEKNLEVLKEYILLHGNENEQGEKFIRYASPFNEDFVVGIVYHEEDLFGFIFSVEVDGIGNVQEFSWNSWMETPTLVTVHCLDEYTLVGYNIEAELKVNTYCNQDIGFRMVEKSADTSEAIDESILEITRTVFEWGMNTSDLMLNEYIGLSLSDIGFEAYEQGTDVSDI